MIIFSQDEEMVVNFDNVKAITIDELSDKAIISVLINDEMSLAIAEYSSKNVAKKVLNMFQDFYRCGEIKEGEFEELVSTVMLRNNGVFTMPKEVR